MLKIILKLGFAIGILYWLISNGKLDFKLLLKVANTPHLILAAFSLVVLQNIFNSLRWIEILKTQTNRTISKVIIIMINWIGLFFSTVLPGAVTGDLIKMFYLKTVDNTLTKTSMVLSVLMDRIFGLVSLLLLMGVVSSFRYNEISSIAPSVKHILNINFIILGFILIGLSSFFLPRHIQEKMTALPKKLPYIGGHFDHLINCFWQIANCKKTLFSCIGFSLLSQSLGITAFYIISSPFYSTQISLIDLFTFIPIGFVVTALPIAPAGMGVGHAAFDQLFQYFNISGGASLFNLYWIVFICNNLLGIIPYIILSKKQGGIKLKTVEGEQPQSN